MSEIAKCRECGREGRRGENVKRGICSYCAGRACEECQRPLKTFQSEKCWGCGVRSATRRPSPNSFPKKWDKAKVIEAFQDWAAVHAGYAPSIAQTYGNAALPSQRPVAELFGSWNAGIEAAGLRARPVGHGRWEGQIWRPNTSRNRQMVAAGAKGVGGVKHLQVGGRRKDQF